MAEEEFLNQDEIDALLSNVDGEESTASALATPDTRVRPYDPMTQQRVIKERLEALDIINERFARGFRREMFNLLRRSADVTVESLRYQSYREFSRNVAFPSNINMVSMKPLRGTSLVIFPPNLVFMVVDNLFGGDGSFVTRSEGREFTKTEHRIIQRMLDLAIQSYSEAWKSVYELDMNYVRSELQAKFANITNSPNEIVLNTTFHIEVGNLNSAFQICIPYSMIEPIRDLLANPLRDGVHAQDAESWSTRMASELHNPEVELIAHFTNIQSRISSLLSLKEGDILPVDIPEKVSATVRGVPVMECGFGSQNGQRALRVERIIDHAHQDPLTTRSLMTGGATNE